MAAPSALAEIVKGLSCKPITAAKGLVFSVSYPYYTLEFPLRLICSLGDVAALYPTLPCQPGQGQVKARPYLSHAYIGFDGPTHTQMALYNRAPDRFTTAAAIEEAALT